MTLVTLLQNSYNTTGTEFCCTVMYITIQKQLVFVSSKGLHLLYSNTIIEN